MFQNIQEVLTNNQLFDSVSVIDREKEKFNLVDENDTSKMFLSDNFEEETEEDIVDCLG